MGIKEKRRFARVRHDSALELFDDAGRPLPSSARLVDISGGGARFATTMALKRGDRVRGRVRLLAAGALDVSGRVVRIKQAPNFVFYGMEFDWIKRVRTK